jgi:hypothetical protein
MPSGFQEKQHGVLNESRKKVPVMLKISTITEVKGPMGKSLHGYLSF